MTVRAVGLVGITLVSAFAGISGVVIDFTASHIYNPAWPPHAQFHGYLSIARTVLIMIAAVVLCGRSGSSVCSTFWMSPR
jgi:hypothetical protein